YCVVGVLQESLIVGQYNRGYPVIQIVSERCNSTSSVNGLHQIAGRVVAEYDAPAKRIRDLHNAVIGVVTEKDVAAHRVSYLVEVSCVVIEESLQVPIPVNNGKELSVL